MSIALAFIVWLVPSILGVLPAVVAQGCASRGRIPDARLDKAPVAADAPLGEDEDCSALQLGTARLHDSKTHSAKVAMGKDVQAPAAAAVVPMLGGRETLNWWNLPVQRSQEQLEQCRKKLANETELGGMRYGFISGREAPELAFECTWVPGLSDQIPEPLRGVFWMNGNPLPSELMTMQNSQWFPEARTLVVPWSPFHWGWGGIDGTPPRDAPFFGLAYQRKPAMTILSSVMEHNGHSLTFEECPGGRRFPLIQAGAYCKKGSGKAPELTFANIGVHSFGNLSEEVHGQKYTLEKPAEGPSDLWLRGTYTRLLPSDPDCRKGCIEMGTYNFKRILDGEGKPVEPWYSEYMSYIGNANLAFWSGYTDSAVVDMYKEERLEEAFHLGWKGYCEKHPLSEFC